MKKIISVLLAVLMMFTTMAFVASATEYIEPETGTEIKGGDESWATYPLQRARLRTQAS